MTNNITKNFTETLAQEFPQFTLKNKAGTWNVDFLQGKTHVLGTKYSFKTDMYVLYLPKRVYALVENSLTEELKKSFVYHEKWGMPYELKGNLETMLSVVPALKSAFTVKTEKTEEAPKSNKTEKKEAPKSNKRNKSNKK